ncbi:hypothetical protein BUALT_Bualt06G0019700 [Buddleja alternifolia]|uniref:Myb/SANT-like domain-containing protein n=1 Tax=Buddleja alternifolia TaxID=168488 RepID=A0AAV6XGH8_9LAMI|nr:hypothetical protein BUALT_Bualt06G0019700 [Buddleja alternifolia]
MKMQIVCLVQMYTVKQLQGKFTRLKVKWKKYYNLLNSQTGMGWDDANNMVTGTEEQWARWLEANPRDASLRRNGCPHYQELTTIFAPYTATEGWLGLLRSHRCRVGREGSVKMPSWVGVLLAFDDNEAEGMDNEDDHVDDVNEINDRVSNVENDVYDDAIRNQYLTDQVNAGLQNFMYYYIGPLKWSFANILKTPYRTSNQKGLDWLNELLVGHEDRFKDNLRMTRKTFLLLCHKIRKTGMIPEHDHTGVQWEEDAGPSQFSRVPGLSDNDLWQQSMLRDAIAQQLWDARNHHG